jgi:hypothetical protein
LLFQIGNENEAGRVSGRGLHGFGQGDASQHPGRTSLDTTRQR